MGDLIEAVVELVTELLAATKGSILFLILLFGAVLLGFGICHVTHSADETPDLVSSETGVVS